MAYTPLNLSTMGDDAMMVSSVPFVVSRPRVWTYISDDAMSSVRVNHYMSDAKQRGMQVGDIVFVVTTSTGVPSACYVSVVIAVDASGADLANGTAITMTNSD